MTKTYSLLNLLVTEANSYNDFFDIEKLVENKSDLTHLPMQPLYLSLKSTSLDHVVEVLPRLSKDQRSTLLDLDLWERDYIDIQNFQYWIEAYEKVKEDEIKKEFVSSDQFFLFLKGRFNVWTFDLEDPNYPEHDHYFITDDNQFLFEFDEHLTCSTEAQNLVRDLYKAYGVDKAYAFIYQMVSESHMSLEEREYQFKKGRLADYGFVDYYEALELTATFNSKGSLGNFISKKDKVSGNVDTISKMQSLHSSALVAYKKVEDQLHEELKLVKNDQRRDFLHFNFLRTVNASISAQDALKKGTVALTRIGEESRQQIELGFDYIKRMPQYENECVFEYFDFSDVLRIGKSLIAQTRTRLTKAFEKTVFSDESLESFLGLYWQNFLQNTDLDVVKHKNHGTNKIESVNTNEVYSRWTHDEQLLSTLLPYIQTFYQAFQNLNTENLVQNNFYLNYNVDSIDFEAILLSAFVNHSLGNYKEGDTSRMAVTLSEFKQFIKDHFVEAMDSHNMTNIEDNKLYPLVKEFKSKFGFNEIDGFDFYLYKLFDEHLTGYNYLELADEDFEHVGGPIILKA